MSGHRRPTGFAAPARPAMAAAWPVTPAAQNPGWTRGAGGRFDELPPGTGHDALPMPSAAGTPGNRRRYCELRHAGRVDSALAGHVGRVLSTLPLAVTRWWPRPAAESLLRDDG